jgi:hypothetical protein
MRFLVLIACLAACLSAGEGPLAGFRFSDGKARSLADLAGDAVLVVYACGHCPSAGKRLDELVAPLAAWADREHRPFTVVVATPEHAGDELVQWAEGHQLGRCLVATDTANHKQIGLQNIWQTELYDETGKPDRQTATDSLEALKSYAQAHGTVRLPVAGLSDPKAIDLWWQVERRQAKAVPNLLAAAKKAKAASKSELTLVVDAVTAHAQAQQQKLAESPADLATVEQLEALLSEFNGIDLKPSQDRLKTLLKDKALKPELEARTAWRTCQDMLNNPRVNVQKDGRANLAALAKRYPDTVYGLSLIHI